MAIDIKKWFMLQVWRLQQVAAIFSLLLLALSLSFQLYSLMKWRGTLFGTASTAIPTLVLIILAVIWVASIYWDLRMKMWREQMAVAIERNPYTKEKMYSKELVTYALMWVPMMERLGRDEPRLTHAADSVKGWMRKALADDPALREELKGLLRYIGDCPEDMVAFDKK